MPLKKQPFNHFLHPKLAQLIEQFNNTPNEDVIQRLFYLQKINFYINSVEMDRALFQWIDTSFKDKLSWRFNLESFGINSDGPFLYKGIQFARAVDAQLTSQIIEEQNKSELYQLLQQRDALLNSNFSYEEAKSQFIQVSDQLRQTVEQNPSIKNQLENQSKILDLVKEKISAIKGETDCINSKYQTEALGKHHVNNFNFKFTIKNYRDRFVFRVEDRDDLKFEQELHSYPVSKYFANDFAFFMMQFKTEDNQEIIYRPVVLSQFANQGSLLDIVERLKDKSQSQISSAAIYYFNQITDFCLKLKEAKVYHPDIKLSNFLVHKNRILVSDRKTFIRNANPFVEEIRATPRYAPPQYTDCLNEVADGFIQPQAQNTVINIDQFMAYQTGMALKEFLILTQKNDLPNDFEQSSRTALSQFQKPNRAISNLSVLVDELTRPEEGKRLSIEQFQKLLAFINCPRHKFQSLLEKELPSNQLGVADEVMPILKLLKTKNLKNEALLEEANKFFVAISERDPREPRLDYKAEQLAIKCYQNYSEPYFRKMSQSIEIALLDKDWEKASLWRKFVHIFTFGYIRVQSVTDAQQIKINLDFNDNEFRSHFIQLEFLPSEEVDRMGFVQANNLIVYFNAHLNEIIDLNSTEPVESSRDKMNSLHTTQKVIKEAKIATDNIISMPKERVQTTKINTLSTAKKEVADEVELSGTVVIKDKSASPASTVVADTTKIDSPFDAKNYMFFAAEEHEPLIKRRSIRRVGTTLFRGEKPPRSSLTDLFSPPTGQETQEIETKIINSR